MRKYCLECDWHAMTDEGETETEVSKRAIEHFVETGHTVDSLPIPSEPVRKN
jgi:predicted small metal-binding protein